MTAAFNAPICRISPETKSELDDVFLSVSEGVLEKLQMSRKLPVNMTKGHISGRNIRYEFSFDKDKYTPAGAASFVTGSTGGSGCLLPVKPEVINTSED